MANRRRSERYQVTIPIVIQGTRVVEKTLTANLGEHGLAVFTEKLIPLGEQVQVELSLPAGATVLASARVVRTTERLLDRAGLTHPGIGFDFSGFDGDGHARWRRYLGGLGGVSVTAAPPPPPEDDAATFLIQPDDSGRLWAFFRGELAQGRVRIESAVLKPAGTPVELLVVHPSSEAEWSLYGTVSEASERGRGRGPMIEIRLEPLDEEGRENFRRFIASGIVPAPARPTTPAEPPAPAAAFDDEDTDDRAVPPPSSKRTTVPAAPPRSAPRSPTFAAFFDEYEESQVGRPPRGKG